MLLVLFAVLAVFALAPVLLPLVRGGRTSAARGSFDRAVYRDQLGELDRDLARGLITESEAAGARLEIQRRLLGTETGDEPSPARLSRSPVLAVVLMLLVGGGASALYILLGAPSVPDVPFASRTQSGNELAGGPGTGPGGGPARKAIEDAVTGLAARLADNPNDGRTWVLYGRAEAMLSNWDKAADAFQRAIQLGEAAPEVQAGYGEMLVMQAAGVVTPPARVAFETVLKADPGSDVARYYLALAAGQEGQSRQAIDQFQALAADLPTDSPMRDEVARRIAQAAAEAGVPAPPLAAGRPPSAGQTGPNTAAVMSRSVNPAGTTPPGATASGTPSPGTPSPGANAQSANSPGAAPPGPDQQTVAAAAAMSEADRKAMIAGMVAKLAARMAENPSDLDGWLRLGRAYTVIGDSAHAVDSYDHALSLKPDDGNIKLLLVEAMVSGLPPADPFAQRAVELLRQVQLVSPDEPAALWYLGLQAARNGRRDEARTYWTRLLEKMPAGQDAEMVKSALDQVRGS